MFYIVFMTDRYLVSYFYLYVCKPLVIILCNCDHATISIFMVGVGLREHILRGHGYQYHYSRLMNKDGLLLVLRSELDVHFDSLGIWGMFLGVYELVLIHFTTCYMTLYSGFTWCIPLSWVCILFLTLILRYVILLRKQYLMHMFYLFLIAMD